MRSASFRFLAMLSLIYFVSGAFGKTHAPDRPQVLFPVVVDDKVGYIDQTGKIVIKPQFDLEYTYFHEGGRLILNYFSEGLAEVSESGKRGYIDNTGKWVIKPQFNEAYAFHDGTAMIGDGDCRVWMQPCCHYGFIDKRGKILIAPVYATLLRFPAPLAAVTQYTDACEEKTPPYFIDAHEETVQLGNYEEAADFSEGLAAVRLPTRWGYKNQSGKIVIPARFDEASGFQEDLAAIRIGKKWGYVDALGRLTIKPQFESAYSFTEGRAKVEMDQKWGYIDKTGSMVIPARFDYVNDFQEGFAEVQLGNKSLIINPTGEVLTAPEVEFADSFHEGLAAVRVNGKWGYIDRSGKMTIQATFDDAHPFYGGLACVKTDKLWGYIDKSGTIVIPPRFADANDLANFKYETARLWDGKEWVDIDKTGRLVPAAEIDLILRKRLADYDKKEAAKTKEQHFPSALKPFKLEGKFGFIDATGKMIIEPRFDGAESFSNLKTPLAEG